jgi:hypothetical protein
MNTYTIKITGTDYTPYNKLSSFGVMDGGSLFDPLALPLSFFHPLTTNCGTLTGSNSVFNLSSLGGDLEICYNDLKNFTFIAKGDLVFCNSLVYFHLSSFDQTRSKIKNLVFNPDNSEEKQTYSIKISGLSLIYPNLNLSNSLYYPNEKYYTIYKPTFKIDYNDGTTQTIIFPLSVLQCGIFDSYKDKSMLESVPYYKELNNIAIFINDEKNNDLLASLLDVKSPFVVDTSEIDSIELPFAISPIPLNSINPLSPILQTTITVPEVPSDNNPVNPPQAGYAYTQSLGIVLNPDPSSLILDETFSITDNSLILSTGGAPYTGDENESVMVSLPLNN